jgi:HEAT repeat protein/PBS lyase HEAT-like repeat-containing protein
MPSGDLSTLLPAMLKQLSTTMKAIAFYPPHHPAVVSAVARAVAGLKEALAERDSLQLAVAEEVFLVEGTALAEQDRALAAFAGYLSRRGVAVLGLKPPLDEASVRGLLEVLAMDADTLRSRGGPARCLSERRLESVSIKEFDPAAALRAARTGTEAQAAREGQAASRSWSDVLARFLTGQDPTPPPGGAHLIRRIAGDEKAARELMASLQALVADAGARRGPILTAALAKIAAEVAAAEPEALPDLAGNLAKALMTLNHACQMDILNASIPVKGTGIDLASEIRARIPDEKIGELVVSLVRSEGSLNTRLTAVIKKVLTDRGANEQDKTTVQDAIHDARQKGSPPPADVWDSIEKLVQESQDDWISKEYKGLLEMVGAGAPALAERTRQELMSLPDFTEAITEAGLGLRAWLLFTDLLEIDREPARLWVALDQIERRSRGITPQWFGDCGDVARAVRAILEAKPEPPPHLREIALKALQSLSSNLVACYRSQFHSLAPAHFENLDKTFEALGPHSVESLLAGLAGEEDWEIRKPFLAFVAARGKASIPALLRRLTDPSWYLVRNVLLILGDIGDVSTIPSIAGALEHPEPRVRRDAVTALGKIGGPRAFALLRDRLGDPEVAEVAMRSLAVIDRNRTIGTFLEMTERVNLLGRGHRRLQDAILTLGALGANESVPRLQSILLRGLWLPPWAGDGVRIAAARALGKIGTDAALGALERGTRLWRGPVRSACREIASNLPPGTGTSSLN